MGIQKAFFYNQNYCIGCKACETACMTFHKTDVGMSWRKVESFEVAFKGRQVERHLSTACNHCKDPECAKTCPVKAYTKRTSDGLVVQDHEKCIGCGTCVKACPYKVPKINAKSNKAEKCDGCATLVDRGMQPDCVRGCPVQVLKWGDLDKLDSSGAVKTAIGFTVFKTGPSIRFVAPKKA